MLDEQRLYEYGGLLAAGYGLYQARKIHDNELEKAKQRHKESIELTRRQHETELKTVKQTYLLELFNSLEQHFQQLNADLIASSRESERDMFDQRNQSFQTIILASSVMFSALTIIIIEGDLPTESGQFLLVAYALTGSLSFSFLFLSIVFCIELVIRTSSFMYKRGKSHTKSLKKAINDTKRMMRDLRGEGRSLESMSQLGLHRDSLNALNEAAEPSNINNIRRAISRMNPNEIEQEFERHEAEIRGYLKKREMLNDSAAVTSYRDEVTGHMRPFKHFWETSCETWWSLAILLFYGGSLNMLLALMIFIWGQFYITLNSFIAAIVGVSLLGLILVVGIATVIVMRHVDRLTHRQDNLELQRMAIANSEDESMRVDLTDPAADYSSSTDRANSVNGSPRAQDPSGGETSARSPPPHPSRTALRTEGAASGGAISSGSGRGVSAPMVRENTGSTSSMTSSPSRQSGGSSNNNNNRPPSSDHRRHPQHPGARATGPSSSSGRSSPVYRTPIISSGGLTMRNLPSSRLETHMEDIESGSMQTDSSVNSMLSLPPRFTPGDNIFQEEPSPRRRFLSSFGRSASLGNPSNKTPSSLYATALRNISGKSSSSRDSDRNDKSSRSETAQTPPQHRLAAHSSQQATPRAAAPANTPATSNNGLTHRSPGTFSTPPAAGGGRSSSGGHKYTPGVARQHNPVVESDSCSNLSNMDGSVGGITF